MQRGGFYSIANTVRLGSFKMAVYDIVVDCMQNLCVSAITGCMKVVENERDRGRESVEDTDREIYRETERES